MSLVTNEIGHTERYGTEAKKQKQKRSMMKMSDGELYHYECKNPKCERTWALREVIVTGTLNRPTCARHKVIDVIVDRNTRRTEKRMFTYSACGPRPCKRTREDVCHCGTPFDWPTQSANVSTSNVSPEFQDLLDRMSFDQEFAEGVQRIARDYSKGIIHDSQTQTNPELIELEIEIETSEFRHDIGVLDEVIPGKEELEV